MAYRELGVIELREVWRRYSAGDGVRAIARGTGVDRKTIAKYVAAAVAVGLSLPFNPSRCSERPPPDPGPAPKRPGHPHHQSRRGPEPLTPSASLTLGGVPS
jgi:hypothetical protein